MRPQSTALPLHHPTPRCLKMLLSPGMHPGLWTPFSIKCNNTKPECDLFFSFRKLIFHAWPNTTELTSISITAAAALPWIWQPAAVIHPPVTDTAQLVLPLSWHCQPPCDPGASKIQILPWSNHLSFFLGRRKAILTRWEINGVGILSKPDFLQFLRQDRGCRYLFSSFLPPIKGECTQQLIADLLAHGSPAPHACKVPFAQHLPALPMPIGRAEALVAPAYGLTDSCEISLEHILFPVATFGRSITATSRAKASQIFANHFTPPFI